MPFFLGFITSFSLPPYGFLIINFITFPILLFFFISNYKKGKWTSFNIGWMFGFGYFISNLYWITNSLTFEEIFKPLIPVTLIAIPLFLVLNILFFSESVFIFVGHILRSRNRVVPQINFGDGPAAELRALALHPIPGGRGEVRQGDRVREHGRNVHSTPTKWQEQWTPFRAAVTRAARASS